MHRLATLLLLLSGIGLFSELLSAVAPDEPDMDELAKKHLVYVEPVNLTKTSDGGFEPIPYVDRRPHWGGTIGLYYNNYAPTNYTPRFFQGSYSDVYGGSTYPSFEVAGTLKRNMDLGSLGVDLGISSFTNSTTAAFSGGHLSITAVRIGLVYNLDTLTKEPYVFPYVGGGGYTMLFSESLNSNVFGGETQIAPYLIGGVAISLNPVERSAVLTGYKQERLQNTMVCLEARSYFASAAPKDPDLAVAFTWAVGLKVEF